MYRTDAHEVDMGVVSRDENGKGILRQKSACLVLSSHLLYVVHHDLSLSGIESGEKRKGEQNAYLSHSLST